MTHITIPLVTAACFFAAAIHAWTVVMQRSVVAAVALAVVWLVTLVGLLWQGRIEGLALTVAIIAVLGGGILGRWLGTAVGWPVEVTQVALVDAIMVALVAVNIVVGLRRRATQIPVAA